ncbi:MAG: ribonuclease III [Raineya sp.]|nr:ribonuclease III [Raineya sp.]MDW8296721.1 ribonuclease III [Raineya sp.]
MLWLKQLQGFFKKYPPQEQRLISFVKNLTGSKPLNLSLYKLALIHSSVAIQTPNQNFRLSNERLEYLGDAVLGLIVAEYLYKKFPYKDEGFLTEIRSRIVNRESLNQLAYKIGLTELIEVETNIQIRGNQSIAGDAMEAFIGAVYLDKGFEFCRKFVLKRLLYAHLDLDKVIQTNLNYKSLLIEYAQKYGKNIEFVLIDEKNYRNLITFTVEVRLDGKSISQGMGQNKKKAEQAAAEKAVQILNIPLK